MLKIKCSKDIMDAFENSISGIKTGYNENGIVSIGQLAEINYAILHTGLEKHSKSKATRKQRCYQENDNYVLRCTSGKLDINSAALYYCAFYIRAGLHPVLIYSLEHVFVGVWMNQNSHFEMSGDKSDASLVRESLYPDNGDLLLIDSWKAINSKYDFWNDLKACERKIPSIRKIFDFNQWNDGRNDCIILDEFLNKTNQQTRENITAYISSMNFVSAKPSRNFRNVHFCNMSEYDISISDMIQQDHPYFIKKIPLEKQTVVAADAALNMGCQERNVLLLCDEESLENISGNIHYTGLNLNPDFIVAMEEWDYFDIDGENGLETLKMLFSSKKREDLSKEQADHIAERIAQFQDKTFTEQDMAGFYELADKQKKIFTIPQGSTKTLFEIWKEYSENDLKDQNDGNFKKEIENAVFKNFTRHAEMLEHIKKFAELRKKCIFRSEDNIFDLITTFNDDKRERTVSISQFSDAIEKICRNQENLNSVYERAVGNRATTFSFEEMTEYQAAFEILLGLKAPDTNTLNYSQYRVYMEYNQQKTYFSGGDADICLEEYAVDDLDNLIKDIDNVLNPPSYNTSHDYKISTKNVYAILKRIVDPENVKLFSPFPRSRNLSKRNEVLKSFRHLVVLRKEILDNIDILNDLNEIFSENISENTITKQCSWLEHHIHIGKNAIAAEKIAKCCCEEDDNDIKLCMIKYLRDYQNNFGIGKTFLEVFLKYIKKIRDFLNPDIYSDYLAEKNAVSGYGIREYLEQVNKCCSQDKIDEISCLAEKCLSKAVSFKLLCDSGVNIDEIPFIEGLYKRTLNDLKKHYSYLITHEKPSQPRIIACTPDQLEKYKDNHFDKMIICAVEKISYPAEWVFKKIDSIIFMSESDDSSECSEESVISLMSQNLNSFDYSEYEPEED